MKLLINVKFKQIYPFYLKNVRYVVSLYVNNNHYNLLKYITNVIYILKYITNIIYILKYITNVIYNKLSSNNKDSLNLVKN